MFKHLEKKYILYTTEGLVDRENFIFDIHNNYAVTEIIVLDPNEFKVNNISNSIVFSIMELAIAFSKDNDLYYVDDFILHIYAILSDIYDKILGFNTFSMVAKRIINKLENYDIYNITVGYYDEKETKAILWKKSQM